MDERQLDFIKNRDTSKSVLTPAIRESKDFELKNEANFMSVYAPVRESAETNQEETFKSVPNQNNRETMITQSTTQSR